MTSQPTSGINSLDVISGPAWSACSQFVESFDSIGIPLTFNQTSHLKPVRTKQVYYIKLIQNIDHVQN